MSVLLFKLRGVPDDEADAVRELLKNNNIDFYETPPSMWGVSMEAIWLQDSTDLVFAKELVEKFQQDRTLKQREKYEKLQKEGKAETFIERLKFRPIQILIYVLAILLILYFAIIPFVNFAI